MKIENLCEWLEWDTNFFGFRIGRITSHQLNDETAQYIFKWAQENQMRCLYFACDANDETSVRSAEKHQLRFVDVRTTFDKRNIAVPTNENTLSEIRIANAEDIPQLMLIARRAHLDSRYYFDANFPRALCERLYEVWIERSCNGYADAVFVVDCNGKAGGYITCHLRANNEGQIGLIALDDSAQGQGYGQKLIQSALAWFAAQNVKRVTVVTQGRNIRAQRLYQKAGFSTSAVALYYHWWI